jgi:nucleoside-diphosphate-sugar epimerase
VCQQEGAFDEYVKDVDAVEHTASPVGLTSVDPQDLIRPALQGTTSVLKSVLVHGYLLSCTIHSTMLSDTGFHRRKNVKRVIYTSSCAAAITAQREGGGTFSEENWNEQSPREVEEKGREAAGMHKYRASKTLAEQGMPSLQMLPHLLIVTIAAWKLWNENKDKVQWDLVTLLPPFVSSANSACSHDTD